MSHLNDSVVNDGGQGGNPSSVNGQAVGGLHFWLEGKPCNVVKDDPATNTVTYEGADGREHTGVREQCTVATSTNEAESVPLDGFLVDVFSADGRQAVALATEALATAAVGRELADSSYSIDDGHICCPGPDPKAPSIRLADFDARIVEEIKRHGPDGVSTLFKIRATHAGRGRVAEITITAEQFMRMNWISSLGAEFRILCGERLMVAKLRSAIQLLSFKAGYTRVTEYTRLGWAEHDGKDVYIHAQGGIGTAGPIEGIRSVGLEELEVYWLPPAATGDELQGAFDAHWRIWDLARTRAPGIRAAIALTAMLPFRAVLGPFNSVTHLAGASGVFKTGLARLAAQHHAAGIRTLEGGIPASWDNNANGLQAKMYKCGDALLLIDDLKSDLQHREQVRTANAVLEMVGNLTGRTTMTRDRDLAPGLNPRGAVISTGETNPTIRSALARALVAEIAEGDIDFALLKELGRAGDAGLFATLVASYIQWLAGHRGDVLAEHRRLTEQVLEQLGDFPPGVHPRHPRAAAGPLAAYEIFLRQFAVPQGLITQADADLCLSRALSSLIDLVKSQVDLQEVTRPGRRFLQYIAAALRSGKAYLLNKKDRNLEPRFPAECGWIKQHLFQGTDKAFRRPEDGNLPRTELSCPAG
jgi:hypothetical protein